VPESECICTRFHVDVARPPGGNRAAVARHDRVIAQLAIHFVRDTCGFIGMSQRGVLGHHLCRHFSMPCCAFSRDGDTSGVVPLQHGSIACTYAGCRQ
jgi:hypothetical protein